MKHLRTTTRLIVALLLLCAIAATIATMMLLRAGTIGSDSALERWIGNQLLAMVNQRLNPQLSFDTLDYRYPQTVVLTGARLTADDPHAPDGRSTILRADRVSITLDRIPTEGQPLILRDIEADRPVVRLLTANHDHRGLVGYSDMVADPRPTPTDQAPRPLSEVFRMTSIDLRQGQIVYDPRQSGQPPMVLTDITSRLAFENTGDGWYRATVGIQRPGLLDLRATSGLNLDTLALRIDQAALALDLASEARQSLPPAIQALLETHAVRGQLQLDLQGHIPLSNPTAMALTARATIADAHLQARGKSLDLPRLHATADLKDHQLTIHDTSADILGGHLQLTGTLGLDTPHPAALELTATDLDLATALRHYAADSPVAGLIGRLEGKLGLTATATVPLADLRATDQPATDHPGPPPTLQARATLDQLALTADDPQAETGRSTILSADRITLELDQWPAPRQPLALNQIHINRPILRLLDGGKSGPTLLGFDHLLPPPPDTAPPPAPAADPPRLDRHIRIDTLQLRDGEIHIDHRRDNLPPMALHPIQLDIARQDAHPARYHSNLRIERPPALSILAQADLQLDTLNINLQQATLNLDLDTDQARQALSPAMQRIIADHQIRGELAIDITGKLPLHRPATGQLSIEARVDAAHFQHNRLTLPVTTLRGAASIDQHRLQIQSLDGHAMGGQIHINGHIALAPPARADLSATFLALRLEQILRGSDATEGIGQLSGRVDGRVRYAAPLAALTTATDGSGTLRITDGRLSAIPVIDSLSTAINRINPMTRTGATDSLTTDYTFDGDAIRIDALNLQTLVIAATGTGRIGFDRTLHLDLKAGPLQNIPLVGQALRQITDNLVRYRVTGTIGQPKVTVVMLGAPDTPPTTDTPRQQPASDIFNDLDRKPEDKPATPPTTKPTDPDDRLDEILRKTREGGK